MRKKSASQKGFTILELVVVAGIIILILSIIASRLDVSRAKARDTKKVSELKTLQTALELYNLDSGYPKVAEGGLYTNSATESSMSLVLNGIVNAGYLSAIPVPPKGSSLSGGDAYFYKTGDTDEISPECDGKSLGEVPYIIYFVTEQPQNLPELSNNGVPLEKGYCLTL